VPDKKKGPVGGVVPAKMSRGAMKAQMNLKARAKAARNNVRGEK
jgi:hypothetical protein